LKYKYHRLAMNDHWTRTTSCGIVKKSSSNTASKFHDIIRIWLWKTNLFGYTN